MCCACYMCGVGAVGIRLSVSPLVAVGLWPFRVRLRLGCAERCGQGRIGHPRGDGAGWGCAAGFDFGAQIWR